MYKRSMHIVPEGTIKERLRIYSEKVFHNIIPSAKGIKKAIARGEILLNGEEALTGDWIGPKDKLELLIPVEEQKPLKGIEIDVVYEDDYLAIVCKPPGLPVSGNYSRTLENGLHGVLQLSNEDDFLSRLRPVHRLDSVTSGLVLVAKTVRSNKSLGNLFISGGIKKSYVAIVIGRLGEEKGRIDLPIDGKYSKSSYELVRETRSMYYNYLSLVNLYPHTGRTHQLRKHMSMIGYPILGDKLYHRGNKIFKGKGLFLCAKGLSFCHPFTKQNITVSIDTPSKFDALLKREENRWRKYNEADKGA